MIQEYEWNIQYDDKITSVDDLVATLLSIRGIKHKHVFVNPKLPTEMLLHNDFSSVVRDADRAVTLILHTIKKNKPIVIHGDYDVDGQTATSILWRTIFFDLNYKHVYPYIPNRFSEGYGFSQKSLLGITKVLDNSLVDALIITVDCGITSKQTVSDAKSQGIKVIITDHHQKPSQVPDADVTVWTTNTTGAGISWIISNRLVVETSIAGDCKEVWCVPED